MPPTVHKILVHGLSILKNSTAPIGTFSEEVLESSHKLCKLFRRSCSQKSSRMKKNRDIFQRLLLHSDIRISLLDVQTKKQKQKLPLVVLNMLESQSNNINNNSKSDTDSDSDSVSD